jgi:hypothetical protein
LDIGDTVPLLEVDGRPAISYARYLPNYEQRAVYNRATNALGSEWSSPVVIDEDNYAGLYSSLAIVSGNPAITYLDWSDMAFKYARATDAQGSAWGSPVTVYAEEPDLMVGNLTKLLVAAEGPRVFFEGLAHVVGGVDSVLCYASAADSEGTSWNAPDIVWGTPGVTEFDGTLIADRPTVALLSWESDYGDEIWVGTYY